MRFRLHTKFIALLVSVSLAPLIIVSGITLLKYQATLSADATALESQLAATAAAEIRTFITSQFGIIENVADIYNPDFPIKSEEADRLTEIILLRSDNFMDISVTDKNGKEITRKDRILPITPDQLRDRNSDVEFQAVKVHGIYVGPVYVTGGRPFFDIGEAITDVRGNFSGAVFAQVDARVMPSVVADISRIVQPPGRVYVVNEKGVVIAHPDISYVLAERDLSSLPTVHSVTEGQVAQDTTATYTNENGDAVLGSAHPMTIQVLGLHPSATPPKITWYVIAEQPVSAVFSGARDAATFTVILSLIALILAAAAAVFFAGRIARPIEALHTAALEFGHGNLSYRAEVNSSDEIGDLAKSFNATAAALEKNVASLKEAQKETADERNKLRLVLSSITNGVVAVDRTGTVILFNRAAESLTGLSANELLGKPLSGSISLQDKETSRDISSYCFPEGERSRPNMSNLRLVSKRGEEHFVNLSSDRIKSDDGQDLGCALTFQDMTRDYILDRSKHEFVTIAAHQLRTPLTGLSWTFESLLAGSGLDEARRKTATAGKEAVMRMIELVNDLLDVSQIEEGRFGIHKERAELLPIVHTVAEGLSKQAQQKRIRLTLEVPAGLPEGFFDVRKIEFVLSNLIDNAIKYTPADGEVTVSARAEGKLLAVSVKDTGIGIPPEERERIFSKFFRAKNAVSFHPDGSGLGLYVVKNIIEQHGGSIDCSTGASGTTFTFTVPLA